MGEVVEQVVERLEERRGPRQAIQVELEYAFNYQGCTPRLVPQGIELPRPTPQKLAKAAERGKVDFNLLCLYLLTTLTRQTYTLSGNQLIYALLPGQVPQPTCFWKWVGCTIPLKQANLTLEAS